MQTQHEPLGTENSAPVHVSPLGDAIPRDAFGRTLEQAQQEDHSWREGYLSRVRAQVARLNRLQGHTGIAGVVISVTLLFAACIVGMNLDPVRHPRWSLEQGMRVFYALTYGTVGVCLLGIVGMGLWGFLQEWIRRHNQQIGIEIDASPGVADRAGASASFLDCGECGASVPVQMPTCRLCGAHLHQDRRPPRAAAGSWLGRTYQTQTLSHLVRDIINNPLDTLGFAILAVMVVAAILGWFF